MPRFFIPLLIILFLNNPLRAQNDGAWLFGYSQVHDIRFEFWQTNYLDSLTNNYAAERYMPCNMEVNGVAYDSIGIKYKGNSSYNNSGTKKPFKVDLNEYISGQKIDGLKKFNLNNAFKDPSFLREKLFLDFLRTIGVPAPRCTYARVTVNGTYWGLYTLVEEVNEKFCDQRFGNDIGNLFKGDPQGNLQWYGNNPSSYYSRYELHSNQTTNDWNDLVDFINILNNTPSQNFYDSLETRLNTGMFLRAWAAGNLFVNLDAYLGSGHNYFIYHNALTNKFEWITWDVNEAFGNFQMGMNVSQLEALAYDWISNPAAARPLCNKMLANATYRSQLINHYCDLVFHYMDTVALNRKADSIANVIRPEVYSDTRKFFTNQHFEQNINQNVTVTGTPGGSTLPGIKSFFAARKISIANQLQSLGCFTGIENPVNQSWLIYPNPASASFELTFQGAANVRVFHANGQTLYNAEHISGPVMIHCSEWPAGIYFVQVLSGEQNFIGRLAVH